MHSYIQKIDFVKKNNKINIKNPIISIDIGKNKCELRFIRGCDLEKQHGESCRSLKFSFWTHFCIGTKQRTRLGYLLIANARIYNDSVSDFIVL